MTTDDINQAKPQTIGHVIGQTRCTAQLKVALDAYFNDRAATGQEDAFPHTLLVGPPGVGKSLLSDLIAKELAVGLHEDLAQNLKIPSQLHGLLMMAEPGDVVFLDEIHELPPAVQTTLYRALEERRLFLGGDRKSITLPPLTFVGATTDEWALSGPLRQRFKLVLRMTYYSEAELTQLVKQRAKRLKWEVSDDAVAGIAAKGRGTPRIAIRFLENARRHARAAGDDIVTFEHLKRMCDVEGIDSLGLDSLERRYLEMLKDAQGPIRLNVIATHLGLPRRTVESVIEAELIRLGLVTKAEDGRMLTAAGVRHLSEK